MTLKQGLQNVILLLVVASALFFVIPRLLPNVATVSAASDTQDAPELARRRSPWPRYFYC